MMDFENVWIGLTEIVEPEDKAIAKLFYELGRFFEMEHGADIPNMATLDALKAFIEDGNTEIQ